MLMKAHPNNDDAVYCAVIEKFVALLEQNVSKRNSGYPQLEAAVVEGRKQGLEHVLYRIRGARG